MAAEPASGTGANRRDALTPTEGNARYELALDLQRELKRVGCYWGPINGVWGTNAKYAMGQFVARVNAGLSFDRPDYALLTLVRGHLAKVCNADCAPGEVIARDGRCLPSTVLARSHNDGATTASASRPLSPVGRPVSPLPGRMAIGGPAVSPGAIKSNDLDAGAPPQDVVAERSAIAYLDPSAATTAPAPDEAFRPNSISPTLGTLVETRRPSWRTQRSDPRRTRRAESRVRRSLPFNRRYIQPPRYLGQVR